MEGTSEDWNAWEGEDNEGFRYEKLWPSKLEKPEKVRQLEERGAESEKNRSLTTKTR